MKNIACIIVSYNPDNGLIRCFDSLISQVDKIIIVDNGSNAESLKIVNGLKDSFNEKVDVILNNENVGIATALNNGIKQALKQGYKWIITSDQDSKASENMVSEMFRVYNSLPTEEQSKVMSIFPNFIDERIETINDNEENLFEYVDAEITSGNLLKSEVFDIAGFFDDSLFIDMVDTDYCMRLNELNIKMIKVKTAILYHNLGDSQRVKGLFGSFNTSNHSALRRYYMTRNRLYTWKKYKNLNSFTLNRDKKIFCKEFVKIILGENDKINKVKMIYKGYRDYRKGIRGKLKV